MNDRNINIFKKNFYCNDIEIIKEIYRTKDDVFLFNIEDKFIEFHSKKNMHPLFLNYNYCLFCYKKRKTKYFEQNLIKYHKDDTNIFNFIKNNNIKLKQTNCKKEKIIRRFIHSLELEKNSKKINNDCNCCSDTELYIDNKINIIDKDYKKNKNSYKKNNSPHNKNYKDFKYTTTSSKKQNISNSNTINSKDFSIIEEKNSNFKEIILEGKNLNINDIKKKRKKSINFPSPLIKLKSESISNNIRLEDNKFLFNKNKKLNKSSELLIVSEDNTNNSPGYLSLIKNFALNNFQIIKKNSKNININAYEIKNKYKFSNNLNQNYELKNENCSLCLGEIQEKFTLICGDFFCRRCITENVKNCLNDISKFDKMICPSCSEIIEENTLKKLLTEKEFLSYQKTSLRIKGIRDKNLIPCPYPDCEGFAEKTSNNKRHIFFCQNNHFFCSKCQEVVDQKFFNFENYRHKCVKKFEETLKYLHSQRNIKQCPNCNCWVLKEQKKCNNMICSNIWCKYQFCWICEGPYEENHYNNPFSMCFGLASSDPENDFTRGRGIRIIRCVFIFLLIIFIFLPFLIILFSIIEMILYIIVFVLDGSALKYIKLKSSYAHKLFYKFAILFYFWLSLALIPVGYMSLAIIIIFFPIIYLIKKQKWQDECD